MLSFYRCGCEEVVVWGRGALGEGDHPGTALLGKHPHLSLAVLSIWQTMRGKLDQRGLLEQELQKIWATKS